MPDTAPITEDRALVTEIALWLIDLTRHPSNEERLKAIMRKSDQRPAVEYQPSFCVYFALRLARDLAVAAVGQDEADRHLEGLLFPGGPSFTAAELVPVIDYLDDPSTARKLARRAVERVGAATAICDAVMALRATVTTLHETPELNAASVLESYAAELVALIVKGYPNV